MVNPFPSCWINHQLWSLKKSHLWLVNIPIFPECVARVPVSFWGSGGWGCGRSSLRLWRNRPQLAMPMVSSAGGVIFGGFTCGVASFRVAGMALRDIQTCFVTCRKSFCVAGAILLRRLQKMRGSFRGRRSTLDVSIVILRGRRSTLDVSCWVFLQIALAGLRQVAPRYRCGVKCEECGVWRVQCEGV